MNNAGLIQKLGIIAATSLFAMAVHAADPAPTATAPAGPGAKPPAAGAGKSAPRTWTKEDTCQKAWADLARTKMLGHVKVLKETDCKVMHVNGWLPGPGVSKPDVCVKPWNALASAGALDAAKALVSNHCPIMAKNGWK